MTIEHERIRDNVHKADTEDLLDRATVYRAGMEPEALEIIEEELHAKIRYRAAKKNRRHGAAQHRGMVEAFARTVEQLTALLIAINTRYKVHSAGLRITGLAK